MKDRHKSIKMKNSILILIAALFFASSCKKEAIEIKYKKTNWVQSPTNPFIDSTSQIAVGSATLYVMFKGSEHRCEIAWQSANGELGRFYDSGKYSHGAPAIVVPHDVEEDCKKIMEKEGREYMVFVKPLNPYTDYIFDDSYKKEANDTLDLKTWNRIQ